MMNEREPDMDEQRKDQIIMAQVGEQKGAEPDKPNFDPPKFNEHVEFLTKNYGKTLSPLGVKVAKILGFMFDGLHHIHKESLHERTHWNDAKCIEVVLYHNLATFDGDLLTELVILSHDECVRVEVNAKAPNYVQLLFSPRVRDDGKNHLFERMPTMEDHITQIRKHYGKVEP